jgi:hypothetical protein
MWSQAIKSHFATAVAPEHGLLDKLNGFYDAVLHSSHCFDPESTSFTIISESTIFAPESTVEFESRPLDNPIAFIVESNDRPVLFIEVDPGNVKSRNARATVEGRVRRRFTELVDTMGVSKLYGIGALGSKLAYFTLEAETGRISPPFLPQKNWYLGESPISRWDTDIMEEDGFEKFVAVVNEVKVMAGTT